MFAKRLKEVKKKTTHLHNFLYKLNCLTKTTNLKVYQKYNMLRHLQDLYFRIKAAIEKYDSDHADDEKEHDIPKSLTFEALPPEVRFTLFLMQSFFFKFRNTVKQPKSHFKFLKNVYQSHKGDLALWDFTNKKKVA